MKKIMLFVLAVLSLQGCDGCQAPCNKTIAYPHPGACPINSISGSQGGPCPDWPGQCPQNTACYNGTCLPCGSPGLVTCLSNTCPGGGTPVLQNDGPPLCDGSCGALGQPCCPGDYCTDGTTETCDLNQHKCVAKSGSTSPCGNNSDPVWSFYLIDPNTRCLYPPTAAPEVISEHAPDAATAQSCAQAQLQAANLGALQLSQPNQQPTEYDYCVNCTLHPNIGVQFWNFSQSDVEKCIGSQYACPIAPLQSGHTSCP